MVMHQMFGVTMGIEVVRIPLPDGFLLDDVQMDNWRYLYQTEAGYQTVHLQDKVAQHQWDFQDPKLEVPTIYIRPM